MTGGLLEFDSGWREVADGGPGDPRAAMSPAASGGPIVEPVFEEDF
jgi:hypothetical protein